MSTPTRGPWCWVVNPKQHTVELSRGQYGDIVLGFERWGMGGATPRFNVGGLMRKAVDVSVPQPGREHHADWWRIIDHPDARLIEAAPDLYEALRDLFSAELEKCMGFDGKEDQLAAVEKARAAIARVEGRS